MRVLRYICVFLILIMLAGSASPVYAQDYRFQVPEQAVVVSVNNDGSINIAYTMTFLNDSGAHAIDIVDIGLPNYDYELRNITAEVDGVKITRITNSDVVSPGISLYLGTNEIPAGGRGTVHAYITNVRTVIYPATEPETEDYASLKFSPNWYDRQYCYGDTNYQFTFLLPPGIKDGESRYYFPDRWPNSEVAPESMITAEDRIFYTWVEDTANTYTQYTFGTSFPARYLAEGAVVQEVYVPPSSSGGNSTSFNLDSLCPLIFCFGFLGFTALIIYSATIGAKKRKMAYLPPKISMEGHGVKRGLTSVEAAVLMEQPMDKIFTMVLFGLLKKNAAEVVNKDPLDIKASTPVPPELYGYETDFLAAFTEKASAPRKKLLQTMMVNLIKSVGEKMKGFSRKETLAFYEDIMRRAWTQVETAGTPEVKAQVYEEVMDWTMLDKKYEDRTQNVFSGPSVIPAPSWWWRYDPTFMRPTINTSTIGGATPPPPPLSTSGGQSISMPTMPGSAFAASVVGSVSNFSSKVMGGLSGFTSGVTNVTNPPPPPSTYRSSGGGGSSGGRSCACACACAGCACACAGGGR
ncbi:MAG: hypothetical protein FP831_08300 [Anaerolineae bacterium]|nr:hypothetical protein [Anaerolineae bacterium]